MAPSDSIMLMLRASGCSDILYMPHPCRISRTFSLGSFFRQLDEEDVPHAGPFS